MTARFTIRGELGRGGMGVVFRAYDALQDAEVALKTVQSHTPEELARLRDEFRIVRRIAHPNVTAPWELFGGAAASGLVDPSVGHAFFIMPIVHGDAFDRVVGASIRLEERLARVRALLPGVLEGLAALHARGIVHGDVKPNNLFVHGDHAQWFDFGLSRRLDDRFSDDGGAPTYTAPEVLLGEKPGTASDVYGLGVVIFECLAGRPPFEGPDLFHDKLDRQAPRLRELAPWIDASVDDIVARMLELDPAQRVRLEDVGRAFGLHTKPRSIRPSEVFVGREAELTAIREAFEAAAPCRLGVVHLHGPSGIGKSALVREFVRRLPNDVVVVRGACDPRVSIPYESVAAALDALVRRLHLEPAIGAHLVESDLAMASELFPTLQQLRVEATTPMDGAPEERRVRAVAALRRVLGQIAARARLVVVIDDFQWAGDDTHRLLDELLVRDETPGALWVVVERDPVFDTPSWTPSPALPLLDVPVTPLSDADLATAWHELGGPAEASGSVVDAALGNPYVVRFLIEHPQDEEASGSASRNFVATVERTLRALPREARQLVELVSVAESGVPRLALLSAGELRSTDRVILSDLEDQTWLATADAAADLVVPYHLRIAEVVTGTMTAEQVAHHHGRLYGALRRWGATDARLYPHALGAGLLDDAAHHAEAAAEAAMARFAFSDAAAWFARALERTQRRQSELEEGRAYALVCAGRSRDAAAGYLRAAACVGPDGGHERAVRLRTQAADHLLRCGAVEEGMSLFGAIFTEIREAMPTSERAAQLEGLRHRLAMLFGWRLKRDPRRISPDVRLRLDVLFAASWSCALQFAALADALQLRQLRLALREGDVHNVVKGYMHEISVDAALGGGFLVRRAEAMLEELRRLAGNVPELRARAHGGEMALAWARGQWGRCIEHGALGEALFAGHTHDARYEIGTFRTFRFSALWWSGRIHAMSDEVDRLLEESRLLGDTLQENTYRLGECSSLDLVRDRPQRVLDHAAAAAADWDPKQPSTQRYLRLHGLLRAQLYLADPAAGWEAIEQEWSVLAGAMYATLIPTRAILHVGRAGTAIALARTRPRERPRWVREARRSVRSIRSGSTWTPHLAVSELLEACLARAQGRLDVLPMLRSAATRLDAADMPMHAAAARAVDEDHASADAGRAQLSALGVRDVDAFLRVLVPGWTDMG